ncbi:MAG: glycoside hydrolase family 2 TIM barrel-domain containing protein [Ilumatobacter sp.]|uniref:glycoside hydrolase family 2 protein n=1 Tax=Ilumatobacter sp. TaxID=1967498 RepID=UPI002611C97C|nr:glycoside hydrolase family 2 TIM barrel-domain containing protein [Ilumatobacter sp.]MDJ0770319.1 glycoside hydrolase family 2 TIM barrel-domain containing protein [Ilumatobacter sp.]
MNSGTTLLTNVLRRERRSLDGAWHVIVDPYEMGYVGILGERNDRGFFRDFTPRHPADRVEYDFDASPTLTVPGDWNTQDERLLYYEGTVWYRRRFTIDGGDGDGDRAGRRRFLNVGAANHTSRVFLDGEELATHAGGFGPFAVELTGCLEAGEHSLVMQVDNRREPDRIPAMRSDWWNFGGLTRSVDLIEVPEVFLRDAWITMAPDGRVVGGVTVDSPDGVRSPAVDEVTLRLPGLGVETTVGDGFELDLAPVRWHPGRPILHDVEWQLGDDIVRDEVGFRTVATDGTAIVVNGEPTFLHGISIHGEAPSGGRRAHGRDDATTLLGWAQDLGANFVRLAHYQHDEHMVVECDRRGLLAWCELPVYWGIAFERPHVLENARAQLDELVVRDRSRAAIAFWSVANETAPSPARTEFLASLADHARTLDPTRLVSAALLTLPTTEIDHLVDDPLGEAVDVVAVNQYLGWYYGDRTTIAEHTWRSSFGKPMLFTELGAGAKAGRHGSADEIWTEEFQAEIYRSQIEMVERGRSDRGGEIAGLSPWILKDFRAPVRVLPGIQDGYNRKGLVSEEGDRKLAFDVLADYYQQLSTGPAPAAD